MQPVQPTLDRGRDQLRDHHRVRDQRRHAQRAARRDLAGARLITLRRAVAADASAVAEVFLDSFHATYEFPLAHTDDEVRGWIRDRVIPTMEAWVATDDDGVVGMMVLAPGMVEQLYVAPERLGDGIGRRLVDLAKERSSDGLSLWTFQTNDRARRFYERNGFVAAELTDGSGNQERQPDVRYEWSGANDEL